MRKRLPGRRAVRGDGVCSQTSEVGKPERAPRAKSAWIETGEAPRWAPTRTSSAEFLSAALDIHLWRGQVDAAGFVVRKRLDCFGSL